MRRSCLFDLIQKEKNRIRKEQKKKEREKKKKKEKSKRKKKRMDGRTATRGRLISPDWNDKTSKDFRECITCLQDSNAALGQKLDALNNSVNALQKAAGKGKK